MLTRILAALAIVLFVSPVAAQSEREVAEQRLYVQRLEEQVRQLTGEVERLTFELRQTRGQAGSLGVETGAGAGQAVVGAPLSAPEAGAAADLGSLSVAENDPLIAPDGAVGEAAPGEAMPGGLAPGGANDAEALAGMSADAPISLSDMAQGGAGTGGVQAPSAPADMAPGLPPQGAAEAPPAPQGTRVASLSGSPRDEYDLAYGYILTGDYGLAEEQFRAWLDAFPGDAQADDARFWLAESQLQQSKHREAANAFLDLYKRAPQTRKAPDALMKLGVALAALGERDAACATLGEVSKRYPDASSAMQTRVAAEQKRAGC